MRFRSAIPAGSLALLVVVCALPARETDQRKPDFAEARNILLQGIQNHAFPGCSVEVGTDDKVLWSAGYGQFDYDQGARVEPATIYDLASVTKVVGTTSVYMRLVALGRLSVGEPAAKHLPEFLAAAPSDAEKVRREKITLEHLLTHTAGLAAWKPLYKSANSYAELLQAVYAAPLESEPGEKLRYSDLGMILAGEIASRAGGKPLAELERELVFLPLGMTNTMRNPATNLWFRIPPTERITDTDQFVHGVVHDENARAGGGITGHAGLFSTAQDLGKLAAELLRALDGRSPLFPRNVAGDFLHDRHPVRGAHRALGWGVFRNSDGSYGPAVAHNGFTGTYLWMDPTRKLYVVLLTNRVHPTRDNNKIGPVRAEFLEAVLNACD